MTMTDERVIRTLRAQAWERAKGEMVAVLQTYWDTGTEPDSKFRRMKKAISEFVKHVQDEGLAE